jgi:C4-dicarboxylate transporter DctQ subunit
MQQILIVITVLLVGLFFAERNWPDRVTRVEEGIIALLLATITLVSFTQVVMRYGFNSGWGGALETTQILFAWLILFGMSYAIKINAHLGVDIVVNMLPSRTKRIVAMFGAIASVLYAVILLQADWLQLLGSDTKGGALFYWSKMFQIGIGLESVNYPSWAQEFFGAQDRVQRWIAYLILPIGLSLFAYRCVEASINIATGKRELIIAGHEAEELVAQNKDVLKD